MGPITFSTEGSLWLFEREQTAQRLDWLGDERAFSMLFCFLHQQMAVSESLNALRAHKEAVLSTNKRFDTLIPAILLAFPKLRLDRTDTFFSHTVAEEYLNRLL